MVNERKTCWIFGLRFQFGGNSSEKPFCKIPQKLQIQRGCLLEWLTQNNL